MDTKSDELGLTLEQLQRLNETTSTTAEFNAKWIQFGGIASLCQKLSTSTTSGIDSSSPKNVEARAEAFGENKGGYIKPYTLTPGTILWNIFKETIVDRKLLIIQLIFFMEIIPWFLALVLGVLVGEDNDYKDDKDHALMGMWVFVALDIFLVPVLVVLITTFWNYKLQRPFQERLAVPHAENDLIPVLRNGQSFVINKNGVLVGDIYQFKSGDMIWADGIVFEGTDLSDEYNKIPVISVEDMKDSFVFIEAGTKITSGFGKMIVTAIGSNTRCAKTLTSNTQKATVWKPNIFSESVRSLSKGLICTGIVLGIVTLFCGIIRFSINKYAIERSDWEMRHAQIFLRLFFGVALKVLDCFLQNALPLTVFFSQLFESKRIKRGKIFVRNLEGITLFGKITILLNFYGSIPKATIQKFKTAGIKVKSFQDMEKESQSLVQPNSKAHAKLLFVEELIHRGEVVGILTGPDDISNLLALKRAHLGITICSVNRQGFGGALENVLIISDDVEVKGSEPEIHWQRILLCINQSRNMSWNISMFLQLLYPMTIVLGLCVAVGSVVISDLEFKAMQMLWIATIVCGFGVVIAAEQYEEDRFLVAENDEYGLSTYLMPKIVWRNVAGQIVYQFLALLCMAFTMVTNVRAVILVFHTFVLMTILNAWNCRSLERNVCVQVCTKSKLFVLYWVVALLLQFVLVQYGGTIFAMSPLSLEQHGICLAVAIGTLIWGQVIMSLPVHGAGRKLAGDIEKSPEEVEMVPKST